MTSVYSIDYTDSNTPGFTINPGQTDGPGGISSNTGLVLSGLGKERYGEDINENFLKLLENFASPARVVPIILSIQSADATGSIGTHVITYFGDHKNTFINGFQFQVVSSTVGLNDGTYTVDSSTYNSGSNLMTVIIQESFPDDAALYLGDVSFSNIEPNPTMVIKPYIEGQLWYNKTDNELYIYKEISANIYQWVTTSTSIIQPLNPTTGNLWYDESVDQLKVFDVTWNVVADKYLLLTGGRIYPKTPATGAVGNTDGVLRFRNTDDTSDTLAINEGYGVESDAPDIRSHDNLLISSTSSHYNIFDDDDTGTGSFIVSKGARNSGATQLFTISNDGTISTNTPTYENLVLLDNDIPNKKYVDETIIFPLETLDYPTIVTSDNRLIVTPSSATKGGVISISSGTRIVIAKEIDSGQTGKMQHYQTNTFVSSDLDVSSIYYLRGQVINGVFTIYTTKGSDVDNIPGSKLGTVNGLSGGGFDSTVLDILFARIVTSTVGTVPTVTTLSNTADLYNILTLIGTVVSANSNSTYVIYNVELNWARNYIHSIAIKRSNNTGTQPDTDISIPDDIGDRYDVNFNMIIDYVHNAEIYLTLKGI